MKAEGQLSSSFRDPSGFVYRQKGRLLRHVAPPYVPILEGVLNSGLYRDLHESGLLIPHEQVSVEPYVIAPEEVATISYPYEWCFSEYKAAAIATLEIHRRAIEHGYALKDGTAYNIQFHLGRPVLIDTLSFEPYEEGQPWRAYRQFCQHFLAPLALMANTDARASKLMASFIDGIPLDLTARMLPGRTRFNPRLAMHIHLHARAQSKSETRPTSPRFGKNAMFGLIDSLKGAVEALTWRPAGTVWADYYQDTNYSAQAMEQKRAVISRFLELSSPAKVWDLGANTGEFSVLAAASGAEVVAWDFDVAAVEKSYLAHKGNPRLLPLVVDLTNPSPAIGWANRERESFVERCDADLVMALALIHHLAIGNNVPLNEIARFFAELAPRLVIEFVPKEDSQVQRLLSTRDDIYGEYHEEGFRQAFDPRFKCLERVSLSDSSRVLFLLERRAG